MPKWHFQSSSFIPGGEITQIQCLCPAWSDGLAQSSRPRLPSPSPLTSRRKKTAPLSRNNAAQTPARVCAPAVHAPLWKTAGMLFDFFTLLLGFYHRLFVSRNAAVFSFDRTSHQPDIYSGRASLLHVERCHGGGMRCWGWRCLSEW